MITNMDVRKLSAPVLEIEIRGGGPHIGKSRVLELIRRTLEQHGYGNLTVVKQDNDQQHWVSRHTEELSNTNPATQITLIDNNQKPVGVKA